MVVTKTLTAELARKLPPPTSISPKRSASSFHLTQFGRFSAWFPAEYCALRFTGKWHIKTLSTESHQKKSSSSIASVLSLTMWRFSFSLLTLSLCYTPPKVWLSQRGALPLNLFWHHLGFGWVCFLWVMSKLAVCVLYSLWVCDVIRQHIKPFASPSFLQPVKRPIPSVHTPM